MLFLRMTIRALLALRVHSFTTGRLSVAYAIASCACHAPSTAPPQVPPPSSAPLAEPRSEARLIDEEVGELSVRLQGVSVLFPGASRFGPEERVGSWSARRHERTGVTVLVLHKLARRTVSSNECEEQATRSLRMLREHTSGEAERQAFRTPGYYGESSLRFGPDGEGKLILHAAGLARCLSLVVVDPQGTAPGTLSLIRDRFLPTVRALRVDERAHGEP